MTIGSDKLKMRANLIASSLMRKRSLFNNFPNFPHIRSLSCLVDELRYKSCASVGKVSEWLFTSRRISPHCVGCLRYAFKIKMVSCLENNTLFFLEAGIKTNHFINVCGESNDNNYL